MRFLLLLSLVLQLNVSGFANHNPQEIHAQKTQIAEIVDYNGRSNCAFRFQKLYEDSETGLYYNRFRYYNSDTGNYISQDPIGLAGNNPTLYGYVHDPNGCVDVFGLELVRVYHYTISKGYKGIKRTGTVKVSDPSARGVGAISKPAGVYVTTIPPDQLQSSGRRGKMGLTKDKSIHFFSFEIDDSKLHRIDPQDSSKRLRIAEDVNLKGDDGKLKSDVKYSKFPCG